MVSAGTKASSSPYFLINCGLPKSSTVTSTDKRVWRSDDDATFAPPNINTISSAVTASDGVDGHAPYTHARIFRSPVTYSFRVNPGPKFLRLYFTISTSYNNISASQFFLSLQANGLILFDNFSPYLYSCASSQNSDVSVFEFYLPIQKTTLNLTFSPGNLSGSDISYGFANGIEILSVPEGLYINATKNYIYVNYPDTGYTMQSTTSFQTTYRLNVGGSDVKAVDDSGRLGRIWYSDIKYIFGNFFGRTAYPAQFNQGVAAVTYKRVSPDAAPKQVYATERFLGGDPEERLKENLTWRFDVDPGFDYLVRLHFCELCQNVTGSHQRLFDVYINNQKADKEVDVWDLSGGIGSAIYKDYVFSVYKAPLWLALLPVPGNIMEDVLLNGVEILKLNQQNGTLAAPNPSLSTACPKTNSALSVEKEPKHHTLAIMKVVLGVGGAILASLIISACLFLFYKRKAKKKATILSRANTDKSKGNNCVLPASIVSGSSTSAIGSSLPSDLCRRFSLAQIRVATSDFDENLIVGTGGFGKVYKGTIDGGATTVAIKRLNPTSKQGAHEFLTEIEMLSRLRHLHLVSLIGYCNDHTEMILVYEFMPRGTLRDHLMKKNSNSTGNTPLSWKQRLMICVGSARGLHYLHAGAKEMIIHRDVKSTNILLDDKWTAKVSDFGLSKVGPASETGVGHVSTAVKGSIGYLDPEYYKRQQLTEKSDVYSFGVVLFEVLCARAAANPNLPKQEVNLALWARRHYKSGTLHTIVDPNLTGQIAPECLSKFGEMADMCVCDHGSQRPSMGDVVWGLEFALQLQETAENNNINGGPLEGLLGPTGVNNGGDGGTTDDDVFTASAENWSHCSDTEAMRLFKSYSTSESLDHVDMRSGSVFSEIMDPKAR